MSSAPISTFKVGNFYTHQEIYQSLNVGNAGGIRPAVGADGHLRRLVILTTAPTAKIASENPYADRLEGDVLVYTAAGKEGTQNLSGINSRITQQPDERFPVYCFRNSANRRSKSASPRRWEFLGIFSYQRHFQETQVDSRGLLRDTWVFELRRLPTGTSVPVRFERELFEEAMCDVQRDKSFDGSPIVASPASTDTASLEVERRKMLAMTPGEFEHLVKDALEHAGFEKVQVTRYSQDGGIDVEANLSDSLWPLRGTLLQVQAKRWIHTVGRREVAELRGSLKNFSRGAFVTTSHYSKSAVVEAATVSKVPIVLIDGLQFAKIIKLGGLLK